MKNEALPEFAEANSHFTEMRSEEVNLSGSEYEGNHSGLNFHDILFVLFRHKWKILLCTLVGVAAAAAVYFLLPPVYQSEAKLFVRYVVDKSAIDGLDSQIKTPNPQTDTVINSEVEILTSSDLARQVVEAVGAKRMVPGAGAKATVENAIQTYLHGLDVSIVKGTNIISVSFKSSNPKLPMPILQELVKRYFDKHLEVHRSAGAFAYVAKETEQIRVELNKTESQLKVLKDEAGIVSLAESKTTLATELGKSQEELDTAESELAAQQSRVRELETSLEVSDAKNANTASHSATGDLVQKYQFLVSRAQQLQTALTELLSKYTPENRLVKVKQAQIDDLENQRRELEKKNPGLIGTASSLGVAQSAQPDLVSERARLVGLESRTDGLRSRIRVLQERAKVISEVGPRIEELERKKEVEETNYKHSEASLEKARIDETLDPSRIPNISVVQTPSAALKVTRDVKKFIFGLAGGGVALGVAIALLIELVLDRTVKRSFELERRLRVPLLLSIPYLNVGSQRLQLHDVGHDSESAGGSTNGEVLALDPGALLQPFCEAIRDRLGLFFELNNMSHKPKLVAVTGLAKNAGTSTLAAGLFNALSDTADGKVLLVDKPVGSKRFYDMLTQFKASDLDYVVFDMPSLGATSATLPLAGFMDTVLLVVEAEKSNRDAVKRAYSQLAAKTKVSVVFNKSRSYGPRWLEGEL
jgi:succinoglycan biosynthesis transport protein ExoP